MPRPILHIIVFFTLCIPFFLLWQEDANAESNEIYIEELRTDGILSSEELADFRGYKSVTRIDFLRWISINAGVKISQFRESKTPFVDIDANDEFESFVGAGYAIGVLDQFENDGKFLPNKKLTRLQAAKMIIAIEGFSLVQSYGRSMEDFWFDLPKNEKDKNIILIAIQKGLLKTDDEGYIYPNARLSRNDAAWMIYANNNGETQNTIILRAPVDTSSFAHENLDTVEELITKEYWHAGEIDSHQLEDAAISGAVNSLNDDYSVYLPPEETEQFEAYINEDAIDEEEYAGLGVVVQTATGGGMVITEVFPTSPAEVSDIRVGDVVIAVEGENVQHLSVAEIADKIKGPIGSSVNITVLRHGTELEKQFIREKIFVADLSSVTTEVKNNIVWITVRSFKSFTAKDFHDALEENVSGTTKGVIVDLRYNPGGLMDAAQKMLGDVLEEGSIAVRLYSNDGEQVFYVDGSNDYTEIPLVVFQNEYSASASEIFSASIQDYDRGEIIGTTSYGKGIAQTLFTLKRGSLKLTTAEFRSPLQNIIHGKGVEPDRRLENFDDESYWYEAMKVFR